MKLENGMIVIKDEPEVEHLEDDEYKSYDDMLREYSRVAMREYNKIRRVKVKAKKVRRKQSKASRKKNTG
jgi:hypothetical protein